MLDTLDQSVQPCPECGTEIRTDPRFVVWCAACDWNMDSGEPEETHGRLERLRRRLARQHGEKLLTEVTAGKPLRPRRDGASVLAYTIALAVHGATTALVVTGILLVVLGWGSALPLVGAVLLGIAWPLRPRFEQLPDDEPVLYRADAPELFALIAEVAEVVGTAGVHAVVVTADVNASVSTYGLRRRRRMEIGLGLWEILTPQQRIALLGHELGHYANGDTRHGLIIANALRSLTTWWYLLSRIPQPTLGEVALNALYLLPRCAVQGVLMLLDHLTLRATQRGEYLADSFAARAGSTEAAVGLLDRLLVGDSAVSALLREANTKQVARSGNPAREEAWRGLWKRLAAHMDSLPQSEYERQRRCSALRGHSVDTTHPPTHLRRVCLLTGAPTAAEVVSAPERQAALDAELAEARETLAREILNGR
ncbi:M48 family metallopeptidase [Streptomyces sp. NPDC057284]|uniref:M48 family metallopeptidase n=1 Tax=Streptomyces sp. NPDC057284 TaxID=3346083 RepID=UPI0036359D25